MSAARDRLRPWAAAAALAAVTAGWNAWTRRGQLAGPVEDETLLIPIALQHAGLASFAGDRWFAAAAPVFSVPYSAILGTLLRFVDDPIVALRWLALPCQIVFLAGTWRVAERAAGRAAAIVATFLCALPPFAALVMAPGSGLPRDLVFALTPWFVLGAEATASRPRAAAALFVALGLVANVHPLTALLVAAWLGLLEIVRDPSPRGAGAAAVRGLAFAAGASPYVAQYLALPAVRGPVDETVYAWRLGPMGGESLGAWTLRMETLVWLAGAAALLAVAARRAGAQIPRWLVVGAGAALLLTALGPTAGRFVPPLRAFQPARFERIAAWCAALLVAGAAVAAWRARRFAAVGAAAALVVVGGWGPDGLGGVAPRGPLARLARKADRDAGVPYEASAPAGLVQRRGVPDPTSPKHRDAFLAVCRFARDSTPQGALFLVPPEEWGPFRVYARRGCAVTRKEGGAAMSFLGAAGMDWFRDYADVVRVLARGDAEAWDTLARTCGATYAVTDSASAAPPAWPVAFEAAPFRVLALPAK